MAQYKKFHYGAKGNLNIWEPKVSPNQFSLASIVVATGSNELFQGIRAGWIVSQDLVFSLALSELHSLIYIDFYIIPKYSSGVPMAKPEPQSFIHLLDCLFLKPLNRYNKILISLYFMLCLTIIYIHVRLIQNRRMDL